MGAEIAQVLDRLKGHGFRFFALAPDGSPLPVTELEVSGAVNGIAIHESNKTLARRWENISSSKREGLSELCG